jgi:hypothetical protein
MNKTAFEIRADLVKLAQDHLEAQYDANLAFATDVFYKLVVEGIAVAETYKQFVPAFPTTNEILAKAKEFYSFVSDKS